MSTKNIIEKADLAVSDLVSNGGYLNPTQSNTFLRMVINQPTVVNAIRVVPMPAPTMKVNKIGFTSRIMKVAPTSGTALIANDRSKPVTDKVDLSTTEYIAEVHIPYDVLEDNVEKGKLEDTIMALITKRVSLDLEELVILGDTGSGDTYLATKDGIIVQSTSHVVDFSDCADRSIRKEVFKHGTKAMPNKYLRDRASFNFWVSPNAEIEYADSLANRQTSKLGDPKVTGWTPNYAFGIPVVPASLMPDDKYILTHPKNVILGIQRQIMLETDRDIRARVLIVVVTIRLDIKYEEEDSVVKCIGLNVDDDAPTTTT